MASSSFHLFQLQKIDLLIDHNLQQEKSIQLALSNNPVLKAAEKVLEEANLVFHRTTGDLKQTEASAQAKQIKIEQSESSLYKGSITNPKELSDLQAEISSLKKSLAQIEETQFLEMASVEEAEIQMTSAKKEYESALKKAETENSSLFSELETIKKNLEKLRVEREVALQQLSVESISVYENLRKAKNRIAITQVEDESCSVCGSEIRPTEIQKSKSSTSIAFCPGCGRILYAG